ncbi:MAG: PEP-CTERM sorting domain-containing protein, partial [Thermoguttaceae bacterium]|nr:PEP-CTERM sorting domain-containing protein [Thermoguttaceae bacterium]
NGAIINSDYTDITMNLNTPDDAYSGIYLARPGLQAQLGDICGDGLVMTGVDGRTGTFTIQVGEKVGAGETSTFTGAFADKANNQAGTSILNVEKVGDGTWVWGESTKNASNIDNYVTNLTVSDGELVLARKSGLSSAKNVTVADGATLTIANAGQEIASSLTLNPNATLQFALSSDPLDSGRLAVPTITLDSSSNVAFSYDSDFLANIEEGLTLPLMNLENENSLFTTKITNALASDVTLSNYFSLVQDGLSFALVAESSYSGVPEPSAWLLLLLGLPFLRRRK